MNALISNAAGTRISLLRMEPFGHGPDHRQFAVRVDAGDLLRIECQIIAEHAGGFLRCDLGHQGYVIQDRSDIVDQGKKATGQCGSSFR
jgi:hypothetical protein